MFGCQLDRPWLYPSGTGEGHFRVHWSKITYLCLCSGTGLRSRNSQPYPTRLRISELGNQVQCFDTFDRGFSTADKLFVLGQLLKVVHGGKNSQMFIQIKTSKRPEIIAGWGHLPISMILRSESNLKSEMLSLARTSKYVQNTRVLSERKSEEDS